MKIGGFETLARLMQPLRSGKINGVGDHGQRAEAPLAAGDRMEISEAGEALSRQDESTTDRATRIAEVRRQIKDGTYNVDDATKHALVADRLLNDIAFHA